MEFSRHEYWSRWPLSSPRDLPDPGTGFMFERLNKGAMINKKVNFIHYTPEYRIEKIDFEQ